MLQLHAGKLQVKEVCWSVERKPRVRLKQVWRHAEAASRRRVHTIRHIIEIVHRACCAPRRRMVPPNHPIAGRGEDGSIERPWVRLHLSGDLRHARQKGVGPCISLPGSYEQAAIAGLPINGSVEEMIRLVGRDLVRREQLGEPTMAGRHVESYLV